MLLVVSEPTIVLMNACAVVSGSMLPRLASNWNVKV